MVYKPLTIMNITTNHIRHPYLSRPLEASACQHALLPRARTGGAPPQTIGRVYMKLMRRLAWDPVDIGQGNGEALVK